MTPQQGKFTNICMNIVLGTIISPLVLVLQGGFTPSGFIQSLFCAFFVGYAFSDLFNAFVWGNMLAAKMKIKNQTAAYFLAVLVLTLVNVTCISFLCTFVNVGPVPFLFQAWWSFYPYLLLPAYVGLLIALKITMKAAFKAFPSNLSA